MKTMREGQLEIAKINQLIEESNDPRDSFAVVQKRIREYRDAGWPVPQELMRIERNLMADLMAESQGR